MNKVLHIFRKDVYYMRWWLLTYCLMVLSPFLMRFWYPSGDAQVVSQLVAPLQWLTLFVTLTELVREDPANKESAFFRTRPIGAETLFFSKGLFIVCFLVGIPVAADAVQLAYCNLSWSTSLLTLLCNLASLVTICCFMWGIEVMLGRKAIGLAVGLLLWCASVAVLYLIAEIPFINETSLSQIIPWSEKVTELYVLYLTPMLVVFLTIRQYQRRGSKFTKVLFFALMIIGLRFIGPGVGFDSRHWLNGEVNKEPVHVQTLDVLGRKTPFSTEMRVLFHTPEASDGRFFTGGWVNAELETMSGQYLAEAEGDVRTGFLEKSFFSNALFDAVLPNRLVHLGERHPEYVGFDGLSPDVKDGKAGYEGDLRIRGDVVYRSYEYRLHRKFSLKQREISGSTVKDVAVVGYHVGHQNSVIVELEVPSLRYPFSFYGLPFFVFKMQRFVLVNQRLQLAVPLFDEGWASEEDLIKFGSLEERIVQSPADIVIMASQPNSVMDKLIPNDGKTRGIDMFLEGAELWWFSMERLGDAKGSFVAEGVRYRPPAADRGISGDNSQATWAMGESAKPWPILMSAKSPGGVRAYIDALLHRMPDNLKQSPQYTEEMRETVQRLQVIGPDNLDELVLVSLFPGASLGQQIVLEKAIEELGSVSSKDVVLRGVKNQLGLMPVVIKSGWVNEIRDEVLKVLSQAYEYTDERWVEAAIALKDPGVYPLLRRELVQSHYKLRKYELLKKETGFDLALAVNESMADAVGRGLNTKVDSLEIALDLGLEEALSFGADILLDDQVAPVDEGMGMSEVLRLRLRAFMLLKQHIPYQGDIKTFADWYKSNRDHLVLDKQSGQWVWRSPSALVR